MQNPFGNYFIQTILENTDSKDREFINEIIINECFYLCSQKYSSNVVIKYIELSNKTEKTNFFNILFNKENFALIVKNKHVKNIIIKCINYIDDELINILINTIKNCSKLSSLYDILIKKTNYINNDSNDDNINNFNNNNNNL